MEKQTTSLGGFEAILDSFIPNPSTGKNEGIDNDIDEPMSDEELEDIKNNSIEPALKGKQIKQEGVSDNDDDVDDTDDADDKVTTKTTKTNNKKNEEIIEDNIDDNDTVNSNNSNDDESSMVGGFFDAISEKMGWQFEEGEEKPKNVDELINYFSDLIEEQSKPEYYSEEIEALDNFVKQGGDLKKYLTIDSEIDLDEIDLEEEDNQKIVVKKLLKEKGFSDKQIDKKISKYEDAGLLEDEAQDAIEDLKEINEQKKEKLLEQQKMQYEAQVQKQQEFYTSVVDEIKGLNNIRGIAVPEKDKRILIEYILKPDSDGKTKYQKDYAKNGVKGLIESAYFTMNADKLLAAAKREGNNSAIDRFKKSLKTTSINTKSRQQNNRTEDSIWSSVTRQLRIS